MNKHSNALDCVTRHLIGYHQKFATVYPVIYCRKQLDVINYVTFRWMMCGFMRLVSSNLRRNCRSALE